jgi:hypothetical protein
VAQFVSTFHNLRMGDYRVAFILVVFSDYASRIRDEFEKQSMAFAADLRLDGLYVQAFAQHQASAAEEVAAKPWPPEISERMFSDADPALVVIENDFAAFDPREHRWTIIWLSDFIAGQEEIDVRPFLKMLASTARRGEDVIGELHERAERDERRERTGRLGRFAARAGSYVEWKPRLPLIGLAVDVKALLRDLAAA